MSIPVLNAEGLPTGAADFTGRVAEQEIKPHLIHETVVAELAARRAGTHSTKNRGEVSGGGRKPWRQKGTGRARQGSIRAPHWRGGGVTFGPTPRSHGGKVNRKVRAQAFRAALRAHADRGSIAVMDATGWDTPSSKRAAEYLYQAPEGIEARPLLVVLEDPESVEGLSFRNLRDVYVLTSLETEVVDIMAARSILVHRAVWEKWTGGELEISTTEATAKAAPERTAPPEPKKITRKSASDKPKRGRKKSDDDDDASSSVSLPPVEDDVEGDVETDPATAYDAPAADDAEIAVEGEEEAAAAAEAAAEETEDADVEADEDAQTDEEDRA